MRHAVLIPSILCMSSIWNVSMNCQSVRTCRPMRARSSCNLPLNWDGSSKSRWSASSLPLNSSSSPPRAGWRSACVRIVCKEMRAAIDRTFQTHIHDTASELDQIGAECVYFALYFRLSHFTLGDLLLKCLKSRNSIDSIQLPVSLQTCFPAPCKRFWCRCCSSTWLSTRRRSPPKPNRTTGMYFSGSGLAFLA